MTSTLPKLPTVPTISEILDKVSDLTDTITARLPEVKLPAVNIDRLPGVDVIKGVPAMFSVDLTNFDVRKIADSPVVHAAKRAADEVKEVAYTAVGFGVLAVQKAQVRRREFFEARRGSDTAATVVSSAPTVGRTDVRVDAPTQAPTQDIATGNTEPEPA